MQKYFNNVQNTAGDAVPFAQVTVTLTATGATATIYSDNGITTKANPIVCDAKGYYEFFAADGLYTLTFSGARLVTSSINNVLIEDAMTDLAASGGSALVGFLHAGTGAVATTVQQALRDDALNLKTFGLALDGVTDDTAKWAQAIATGKHLYWPPLPSKVTNKITLQNGQVLQGAGRTKSYFVVGTDFNMAASSVLQLGTTEPGAQVFDVGFQFVQANQGVRANVTAYPPAIDGSSIPRFMLDRIRIEAGYDGIKATGNCGGAFIGDLEVGTLRKGIEFDGALDFVHGGKWHFWPFGISPLTTLLNNVYYDGQTQAAKFGLVDGLDVDTLSTFRGYVEFTATAGSAIPNLIGKLQLDGDGARLLVAGGVVGVAQCYDTKTATPVVDSIAVSAGSCLIDKLFSTTSIAANVVSTSGTGTVSVDGGRININNAAGRAAYCPAGQINLNGVDFALPAIAFTQPHVRQEGTGGLVITNCRWPAKGAATGTAVSFGTDLATNFAQGNQLADWTYTTPASPALGVYGPNGTPLKTWTPVATFATVGDFSPTYAVQHGRYRHEVGGIWFECRLVFDTNAFTTAAGGFRITGLPAVNGAGTTMGFAVNRASKIDFSAGYSQLSCSVDAGNAYIDLLQSGDNVAVAGLGITEIKASTTSIEILINGFLPSF